MMKPEPASIYAMCEAVTTRLGFEPFDFQRECWQRQQSGESGLLCVPTGSGKTMAAVLPTLCRIAQGPAPDAGHSSDVEYRNAAGRQPGRLPRLRLLYITPLRALARDIERQISELASLVSDTIEVECRTGDTSASRRKRQRERMPDVLITTPESFALLLSYPESARQLRGVTTLVLDEWHELFGSKRGTQTELCRAALVGVTPGVLTWALSATVGNVEEAAHAACGPAARVVRSTMTRPLSIHLVRPPDIDAFPWAGHLGRSMVEPLLEKVSIDRSTIIFCNTRNQAEQWYQEIIAARPAWLPQIALHHGSIDRAIRTEVEARMQDGRLRWVVATSSLDLGIDFYPVERVVQIGSAKGVSRLLQRAGRSGHNPNRTSELFFVPTHALEILELAALRRAIADADLEACIPPRAPVDVLVQHLVTRSCGQGFATDEMYEEVTRAWSYRGLSRRDFDWALNFVEKGGALQDYPQYRKVLRDPVNRRFEVADTSVARLHRMGIGTITSDGVIRLKSGNNAHLGTVEERFIDALKRGDTFYFGGKALELVRVRDGIAHVRAATRRATVTPAWAGGRLPFSTCLGQAMRQELYAWSANEVGQQAGCDELSFLLTEQARVSAVPRAGELLVERLRDRSGDYLLIFPFEGYGVHEALGAIIAYRFSQAHPGTFTISLNDYGVSLYVPKTYPFEEHLACLSGPPDRGISLFDELRAATNLAERARTRFRDVARIAGLVVPGFPGKPKTVRQVQVSSSLLFDVFQQHDPDNLLLRQAFDEAVYETAQFDRLAQAQERIAEATLRYVEPSRPSPLGFPLYVERMKARLSNEKLADRIARLKERYARV